MPAEIVIVSCGMTTPVGLSAAETAASARSRTARLTSIEWRDSRFKPFTVGVVPDEGLPPLIPDLQAQPLTYREDRMLRLAHPSVEEALAAVRPGTPKLMLFCGLPELHTTVPIKPADFSERLRQQAQLTFTASKLWPQGRAAALLAVKEGCEKLTSGEAEFILLGGVDTYVDLYIMGTLDLHHRVRTEVNPDGFAPGEGSAFLLLTTREHAKSHGLSILAKVTASAQAKEAGHIYSEEPYKGEGLAAAFAQLFAAAPEAPPVGCIYASFNGEHYWAKEFGVAMLRNRERFADDHAMEHPAECFGDLGAAHGAALLALAALRIKRTCPEAPILVFASSDLGDRAAVLLERSS